MPAQPSNLASTCLAPPCEVTSSARNRTRGSPRKVGWGAALVRYRKKPSGSAASLREKEAPRQGQPLPGRRSTPGRRRRRQKVRRSADDGRFLSGTHEHTHTHTVVPSRGGASFRVAWQQRADAVDGEDGRAAALFRGGRTRGTPSVKEGRDNKKKGSLREMRRFEKHCPCHAS